VSLVGEPRSACVALNFEQATDLAARILALLDVVERYRLNAALRSHVAADRERVASDLAGLREHGYDDGFCAGCCVPVDPDGTGCSDLRRYVAGLLRTARLYGVAPADSREGGEVR
jgi:hypothetical protein